MNNKASLVVLAAGMGSRYGGLKQLDGFGPNGETIIDYSLYDAIQAGFERVVFIIRESFKKDFEAVFSDKLKGKIEVEYVTQELANLPDGFTLPEAREKPWGTAHAVLMAQTVTDGPFAVINADDYYGKSSYKTLMNFFESSPENEYSVVGYKIKNTLSDHGEVNRGICHQNQDGYLREIVETLKIAKHDIAGRGMYLDPVSKDYKFLDPDTLVSMNMFGFKPNFFDKSEEYFKTFLQENINVPKSEFFIPLVLDNMINEGFAKVKVLTCDAEWFGVTYKEDKPFVISRINALIENKSYPSNLWA